MAVGCHLLPLPVTCIDREFVENERGEPIDWNVVYAVDITICGAHTNLTNLGRSAQSKSRNWLVL